jgi:uncharacterized protein YndB with AHSA1/START domain
MKDLSVKVSKTIQAPIEKVFDAWLNPDILAQFMLPMTGMPQPHTEINPIQGGEYTIIMQVGDDKIPHGGKYLEISRPNTLIFSWESPFSPKGSTVTLQFSDLGNNTTRLELTHLKFIDEQSRSNHEGGWSNILNCLALLLDQ